MAGSGDQIKALVRSHAAGDEDSFYAVALQVAAQAARQGHSRLAHDLKETIDAARQQAVVAHSKRGVTAIARPKGELADLVSAAFPTVGLRDVVLSDVLRRQVDQVLREQRQRVALMERGYAPLHRLLFEGPPGTGKTLTASVIAHELSLPLLTVRLDTVFSRFMGETSAKLRSVFDAVAEQRAVYLFDEFDALGGDRAGNDVGEARRILNSFLIFLEEASPESLVVAATNHLQILDRALFRRFDVVLKFELPHEAEAIRVVRRRLGSLGRGLPLARLGPATKGLSHAELVKASEQAAKEAIINNDDRVTLSQVRQALEIRRTASSG